MAVEVKRGEQIRFILTNTGLSSTNLSLPRPRKISGTPRK